MFIHLYDKLDKKVYQLNNFQELFDYTGIKPDDFLDYLFREKQLNERFDLKVVNEVPKVALDKLKLTEDLMVLNYVNRVRYIYNSTSAILEDTNIPYNTILELVSNTREQGKYIGGYEFFSLNDKNILRLDFLDISIEEATKDRKEYTEWYIKYCLKYDDVVIPDDYVEETLDKVVMYKDPNGNIRVEVYYEDKTVWLTQKQIAELFAVDRSVISKHLLAIFSSGELDEESNVQKMHIANSDKPVKIYNLDAIIAVGYRVNSKQATAFRIWATKLLSEYLIKGFCLDDKRLMNGQNIYHKEMVDRIRHIRSAEMQAKEQFMALFATSSDYDPKNPEAQTFFATVQNKLHYAAHGHTAAEIIYERSEKEDETKYWYPSDENYPKDGPSYINSLDLKEVSNG